MNLSLLQTIYLHHLLTYRNTLHSAVSQSAKAVIETREKAVKENRENPSLLWQTIKGIAAFFNGIDQGAELQKLYNVRKIINTSHGTFGEFHTLIVLIDHIYHSSDTQFRHHIMKDTEHILENMWTSIPRRINRGHLFLGLFNQKKIGDILGDLKKDLGLQDIDAEAVSRVLYNPDKGPFCFVCICGLRDQSIPAKLPREIIRVIYNLAKVNLLEELEKQFKSAPRL